MATTTKDMKTYAHLYWFAAFVIATAVWLLRQLL